MFGVIQLYNDIAIWTILASSMLDVCVCRVTIVQELVPWVVTIVPDTT